MAETHPRTADTDRRYLVTGADSGLGRAVADRLVEHGSVITSGIGPAVDIRADLATSAGRSQLVDAATSLSGGRIDGIVAAAGIGVPRPETVALNYFGTIAVLERLRSALAASPTPAVLLVSSSATLNRGNAALIRACARGDEDRTRVVADRLARIGLGTQIYRSSKIALNRWVRRTAPTGPWAGAGIVLNAVAPGIIATDLVQQTWEQDRALLETALPQPLGAPGPVASVADLIGYAVSPYNRFMTGQIIYCDGGTDALMRRTRPQQVHLRYRPQAMITMWRAARERRTAAEREEP